MANGGFGPFGGVEGIGDDGYSSEEGMLTNYVQWRDMKMPAGDVIPAWTPGVVSFCNFGCAMWALLDCRTSEGRILFLDEAVHDLDLTLAQWLELWLSDELDRHRLAAVSQAR